jgi:hypothetical protein
MFYAKLDMAGHLAYTNAGLRADAGARGREDQKNQRYRSACCTARPFRFRAGISDGRRIVLYGQRHGRRTCRGFFGDGD